mmetsp:Transcript_85843/g.243395  ORF Transcript_85843/g.243395 Transcript_85843/m.243395 type:complete len:229 (+) Transcript_85843:272-958(+)
MNHASIIYVRTAALDKPHLHSSDHLQTLIHAQGAQHDANGNEQLHDSTVESSAKAHRLRPQPPVLGSKHHDSRGNINQEGAKAGARERRYQPEIVQAKSDRCNPSKQPGVHQARARRQEVSAPSPQESDDLFAEAEKDERVRRDKGKTDGTARKLCEAICSGVVVEDEAGAVRAEGQKAACHHEREDGPSRREAEDRDGEEPAVPLPIGPGGELLVEQGRVVVRQECR